MGEDLGQKNGKIFWWPFWSFSGLKIIIVIRFKKFFLVDTYLECGVSFFIFSQERFQNGHRRHPKVACTFGLTVHVCVHVRVHQHLWKGQETNLYLSWKFSEVQTSFGCPVMIWKKCYFCYTQMQQKFIIDLKCYNLSTFWSRCLMK